MKVTPLLVNGWSTSFAACHWATDTSDFDPAYTGKLYQLRWKSHSGLDSQMTRRYLATCVTVLCGLTACGVVVFGQAERLDPQHAREMAVGRELFKGEVRTVLVGRCLKCHGGAKTKGEFSLATREELLKGGASGPVIELRKSSASLLVRLISHEDEPHMPADGAKLDQRQIDAIAKWIDLGAAYDKPLRGTDDDEDPLAWTQRTIDESARGFWSFQPLRNAEPPKIADDSGGRTDIDRFVLAKLKEAGITPNAPASRRALLRRAYFDLIGLPPSLEEVEAFIADEDPQAYEKLLDRLLASKHHGERVGRHWLDIARFGESHGFEQDYDRPHAYHYRDFVIKAFNADMPFDQFVRWQLAGDEIEPENPLAMMATGFLGAGVFPTQLTEKEFESSRYDELDDMISTMGNAMLGVTIGCARCHDHKFDPIPARDYYQLLSAFRTTIRSNVEIDLDPAGTAAALAKWEADRAPLQQALNAFEQDELPARFEKFVETVRAKSASDDQPTTSDAPWITLVASSLRSEGGTSFAAQSDGSYLAGGNNADFDVYTFETETSLQNINTLRLEALADDSMTKRGPGRAANGNMALSRISMSIQPLEGAKEPIDVKLLAPQATFQQNESSLSIASSLDDDPQSGWAVDPKFGEDHAASFGLEKPIGFAEGTRLAIRLEFNVNNKHNMGRLRLAVSSSSERPALDAKAIAQPDAELQLLKLPVGVELTEARRNTLMAVYKKTDEAWRALNNSLRQHLSAKPQPKLTTVMVSSEGVTPIPNHGDGRGFPHFYKDAFFLKRGDVNQKQGVATEGFLQVLIRANLQNGDDVAAAWKRSPPEGSRTSWRRRAVADWMTDAEHGAGQLLARVIVNRLWQQHLGRGIVGTPNDFGFQGERPTHPDLLDWLAGELIRNQWRLKPVRKLIMTSSVYMQDSNYSDASAKIDPNNLLLWRFSPRRLEAEIIRDALLAVSGLLDETQFGPGTLDEAMRRRSVYFMIKRSKLIPFLQVFDTPEPLASVGQRPSTTIAPQALIFMNNRLVREYAKAFAQRIAADDTLAIESTVRRGYLSALARQPTDDELTASTSFVEQQMASYDGEPPSKARVLAVTDLCQVLMSLSEFLYLD
ncbi:MAG: PSD1 and planctomycete cytochrome C domain-containing protein [Planctomycetota bacterium]|nr:PSD1 and planctomycete cytochrome C domain-containing protein [Planctomycetota bacterium]